MTQVIPPVIPPMDSTSTDIVADNIDKLKELFPEAFTEGKIDFDALKEVLGEYVDGRDERYSFTWNGKSKARMIAQTPSTGTLRPCKEESVDWDTTQNLFIEGDNLEVLKLLQKSYHKKVKMIYIDPPYNTGKDFVYKDNFKDNIKNYKEITGQVDGEGRNLSSNPETSGRYHTDWLNMMYPRLKLARNLLKDDGVIFISIDDNELSNLIKICDELFGEENFIAKIIHKNNALKNQSDFIGVSTEYMLVYSKNKNDLKESGRWKELKPGASDICQFVTSCFNKGNTQSETLELVKELYQRPKYSHLSRWNKIDDKGVFMDDNLSREGGAKNYTIINPVTGSPCPIPPRGWAKSYDELLKLQADNMIWYGNNDTPPRVKSYLTPESESVPDNYKYYDTSKDKKLIDSMFGSRVFEYPKSLDLLLNVLEMTLKSDDIVLDFFAGSASFAHAVFLRNVKFKENNKFILVQLPELLDDTEKKEKDNKITIRFLKDNKKSINLAEISKERIRRAAAKIQAENPDYQGDLGFKVFKLDSTNIKPWELDFDLTEQDLEDQISNIKPDRKDEDVLYEVLLKYGLDLTLPITEHSIDGHKVFNIGMGALMVCLSDNISLEVAERIAKLKDELNPEIMRVVFKDAGFADDVVKTNAVQILKQAGIKDVRSL